VGQFWQVHRHKQEFDQQLITGSGILHQALIRAKASCHSLGQRRALHYRIGQSFHQQFEQLLMDEGLSGKMLAPGGPPAKR
jgi:hypothetical protein